MDKLAEIFSKRVIRRGCACRVKKRPQGFKAGWYLKRFDIVARFGVVEEWEWDMVDTVIGRWELFNKPPLLRDYECKS